MLIVSRAEANVARTIPTLITKTLGKNDNTKDIDTYVRQTIQASSSLKTQFEKEKVNPSKYFHDNANGIFLWVVIVLHQLAQAKSRSKFQKYLTGFSDASGSLEQLYSSVLQRIEGDDQAWIKEILQWVVVGRGLNVDELREVVGIVLEDELQDFQAFLEVEVGSFLHLINKNGTMRIELIHETLHHFLTDPNLCPDTYCIDEQIAHSHALRVCLEVLSGDKYSPNFTRYAAEAWSFHVRKLEGSYQLDILGELREFFDSGGCVNWIRLRGLSLFRRLKPSFDVVYWEPVERKEYEQLTQAFEFFKGLCGLVGLEKIMEHGSERETSAIKWAQTIVDNPGLLGEYVGKVAGEIWLYEDLSWDEAQEWFSVVLNYYLRREASNVDEVEDISENCFERIVTWCGMKGRLPNYKNIAVGYFMLRMWDECVACFERTDISTELWVGMAYLRSKDYIRATEAFERTIIATSAQNIPRPRISEARLLCLDGLSQVYVRTGILNDQISTLDAFQALVTWSKWTAVELLEGLMKRNNSGQMKIFETALYEKWEWWADSYFARAGLKNAQGVDTSESGGDGDIEGRISAYGASGDSNLLKPEVRSDGQLSLPRIGQMGSIAMSCSPDHDRGDRWVLVVNVLQQPFDVSLMHTLQVLPGLGRIKLSPDCKYLGAQQWSGDVRIFDTMSGARVATVPDHTLFSDTRQFAFSPNSKYLLLSRSNNLVTWFDIETREQGHVKLSFRDNVYSESMKFSQCENYLITACSDATVKIWSVSGESPPQIKEQASLKPQGVVSAMRWDLSADGELMAGSRYSVMGVWETATGRCIGKVPNLFSGDRCTYTRLENALVVKVGFFRTVICRKPSADSCLDQLGIDHERAFRQEKTWDADCSPDGERIIIGCADGSVRLWKDGLPQFALKCYDGNSTILFIC